MAGAVPTIMSSALAANTTTGWLPLDGSDCEYPTLPPKAPLLEGICERQWLTLALCDLTIEAPPADSIVEALRGDFTIAAACYNFVNSRPAVILRRCEAGHAEVWLEIRGFGGYLLRGSSFMRDISRSPDAAGPPGDERARRSRRSRLFPGTWSAPARCRSGPGRGFTRRAGGAARISSLKLGSLVSRVTTSKAPSPRRCDIRGPITNLSGRGPIGGGDRGQDHAA
jgi:hypothetical protein